MRDATDGRDRRPHHRPDPAPRAVPPVGAVGAQAVRWHLREKPEVIAGLLRVFLRALETTLRRRSRGAPRGARFGAVAFVHRFGSDLNSHVHFHVLVTESSSWSAVKGLFN